MFLRILNAIMLVLFALSIAVQYNDPDGLLWAAIYGYALVITAMALFNTYTLLAPLGVVGYLAGMALLMPTWSPAEIAQLLSQPKMVNHDVELAREALGLLICACWLLVLTIVWRRRSPALSSTGDAAA